MTNTRPSARALSACLLAAFFLVPVAHGIPLYYTFQGNVIYSAAASHPLGTPVQFTFLVDRDRDGQTMDEHGNVTLVHDVVSTDYNIDYFYASYVGGSAIALDFPASPFKQSWSFGVEQTIYGERFSALRGSNSDPRGSDLIDIWSYSLDFRDWHVGMTMFGENLVRNTYEEPGAQYSAALTLTSISESNPIEAVPEPSTLSFMGLGLLGVGAALRNRRKR